MNWLLSIVLTIILVEFIVHVPLKTILADFISVSQKILKVVSSRYISEYRKEKVLLVYAKVVFKSTLSLALILAAIGVIAGILIYSFDHFGASLGAFLFTWQGIAFSIIVATFYFKVRKALV